jgi:hypothetical protein
METMLKSRNTSVPIYETLMFHDTLTHCLALILFHINIYYNQLIIIIFSFLTSQERFMARSLLIHTIGVQN